MPRSPAALVLVLIVTAVLAGCGSSGTEGKPAATKDAGTNPTQNSAAAAQFFGAVASNDPTRVQSAYALAAPGSPALGYLKTLHGGLGRAGEAAKLSVSNGRYRICLATMPTSCHTYAAVVLADGKVNDFTVDGKRIRLR